MQGENPYYGCTMCSQFLWQRTLWWYPFEAPTLSYGRCFRQALLAQGSYRLIDLADYKLTLMEEAQLMGSFRPNLFERSRIQRRAISDNFFGFDACLLQP